MDLVSDILMQWLHIVAAVAWIGGMIINGLILAPSLKVIDPADRGKLMGAVVKRFTPIAWFSIIILIVTGIPRALINVSSWSVLFNTTYGQVLAIKLLLVAIMIIIGVIIAFVLGPRTAPAPGGTSKSPSPETVRAQRQLEILGGLNLLLGLTVILLAAILRLIS